MANAVDAHPQREQIIADIIAQKPYREIASALDPPIHYTTLQRYAATIVEPAHRIANRAISDADSVDKAWAQHRMVQIIEASMGSALLPNGGKVKTDLNLARATLRDLYEANGWMAPKRTESVSLNLHALPPAQLAAALRQSLTSLPPEMRAELAAGAPDIVEVECVTLPPGDVGNKSEQSDS